MIKIAKNKLQLITSLLIVLLICSAQTFLLTTVHAAEDTVQENGLVILNDVVGLDVTKYAIASKEYPQDQFLGVLPQERVRYQLQADESNLDMIYTFVKGKLQRIHVLESEGSPQMTRSVANSLEMAKDFLTNYQNYTNDPFYGELSSTLTAVDVNKNSTTVFGNTKLEVTVSTNSTTFRWKYIFNGVEAPDKCVALRYINGVLKYFIDNWNLYKIGSTDINFSEKETIDIAVEKAKTLTWMKTILEEDTIELKYNVTAGMVYQTVFASSVYMDKARSEDKLELYPMRHIWVSFDKFYPGNVYGANVYVWADTGEIGFIQERFSTIDPPEEFLELLDDATSTNESTEVQSSSILFTWILSPVIAVIILGLVSFYLCTKKKFAASFNFPRLRFSKVKGVLVGLLLFSTVMVTMSTSIAYATPLQGRATIWGSESFGAWNTSIWSGGLQGSSWRKTNPEVWQQQETAQFIANQFASNGYYSSNYQGDTSYGSYNATILYQIGYNEANYPRVAVVNFDHGNGGACIPSLPSDEFHYHFEDQDGTFEGDCNETAGPIVYNNLVFDYKIADKTNLGKTFFIFINTCNSAHVGSTFGNYTDTEQGPISGTDRIRGMPYAWAHLKVFTDYPTSSPPSGWMSCNGYTHPDYTSFCYMGFLGGSAALNQTVGENDTVPYHYWIEHFFAFALNDDIMIKSALDDASQAFFYDDFDGTTLYNGFTAIWPTNYGGNWTDKSGSGWLKVYGNSAKQLYQPLLTLSAYDNYNNPLYPTFTIDGESQGVGSVRVLPGDHTYNVGDVSGYTFSHFSYKGGSMGRPAYTSIESDEELVAHYIIKRSLTISAGTGGSTNPSAGTYWYTQGTNVQVTANENANYDFSHWILDQTTYYQNPITVTMNSNHNLQPVFVLEQRTLTISAGTGGSTNPSTGQHNYDYGTPVQVTAYPSQDYTFSHWILDQTTYYQNPITVTMNSNHNLQPVFSYDPPTEYDLTVLCYDQYNNPGYVSLYIDSEYVGLTMDTYSVEEGQRTLQVPNQVGSHYFYAWYYDGDFHYNNPTTISVYSDKTATACYLYNP